MCKEFRRLRTPGAAREWMAMRRHLGRVGSTATGQCALDKNSGLHTSGWLGRRQQADDDVGRQAALARGNTIFTIAAADALEVKRKASLVQVQWMQEMNQRGLDGTLLLSTARRLMAKHSKAATVAAPANAPAKAQPK